MRITIFALLMAFALNGASCFFFPDNEIFHPFRQPLQWFGDRFNGNSGRPEEQRPAPGWGPETQRPTSGWRPVASNTARPFFFPPHPKLVASKPSYLGNQNKNQNTFIPEITQGRLPEFKPEDYLRSFGK